MLNPELKYFSLYWSPIQDTQYIWAPYSGIGELEQNTQNSQICVCVFLERDTIITLSHSLLCYWWICSQEATRLWTDFKPCCLNSFFVCMVWPGSMSDSWEHCSITCRRGTREGCAMLHNQSQVQTRSKASERKIFVALLLAVHLPPIWDTPHPRALESSRGCSTGSGLDVGCGDWSAFCLLTK